VIPIEVTQTPWRFTTWLDLFDHWQTLWEAGLAVLAGLATIVATIITARRQITATREQADKQIAAAREEADRVIAAAREQTSVTAEQTATTVRLERERVANEDRAFRANSWPQSKPARPSCAKGRPKGPLESMVRIAITAEAFDAICATLPVGSVAYEAGARLGRQARDVARAGREL
jgi:hypothetical protein